MSPTFAKKLIMKCIALCRDTCCRRGLDTFVTVSDQKQIFEVRVLNYIIAQWSSVWTDAISVPQHPLPNMCQVHCQTEARKVNNVLTHCVNAAKILIKHSSGILLPVSSGPSDEYVKRIHYNIISCVWNMLKHCNLQWLHFFLEPILVAKMLVKKHFTRPNQS